MGKRGLISEIANLLAIALRHRIGSIVNENEVYTQKYARDAEVLIKQAKKLIARKNWNFQDKKEIKRQLKLKLKKSWKTRNL